ncbi:MAG TPA: indolepyruvate ferredoxin oxidoreductase family protein [Alphaproteobacteria bacterium]|nr:indolepyruvate ferredoxin oxidoreductase family protein [Alphaproteobacteria bacterium]
MTLDGSSLDDKYTRDSGRAYMSGFQALVRLPIIQRQRDEAAGLNTAGYVSGYQGSPISGLDFALTRAEPFLTKHHIVFRPGLNEDLAAAAIWGTQQLELYPDSKYDGVFGMWYGKGPGVDRTGDAFVHANAAGTGRHGGVLVIAGDDHAARTTTTPHQSEIYFSAAGIPSLNPTSVQDYLDLGVHGFAMSRYSGLWIGFTSVCDNIESSASVYVDPHRVQVRLPEDFDMPEGGLNIRWPDAGPEQERRSKEERMAAVLAYVRANKLDQVLIDSPRPRFGIVTTGKAYGDVMEALAILGIDEAQAADIGLRLYRVAMTWPLEPVGLARFAEGLEEILVVEEKRPVIEEQIKEQLYNWPHDRRPQVVGKYGGKGNWEGRLDDWLLPSVSELNPAQIARVIAARLDRFHQSETINQGLAHLDARQATQQRLRATPIEIGSDALFSKGRLPYFCSGCPHSTSTRLPEGSRSQGGVGCHFMVMWMDRSTMTYCHMGAEGAAWVGQSPFSDNEHVFANLGDGTYLHSGILAIRAAVAAGVNITYKLLFNGTVGMTGGQPLVGSPTVPQISRQLAAEGVTRMVIVTEDTQRHAVAAGMASGVTIRHRDELDQVQRELRQIKGVSVLIYDQACATERRRQRKRGLAPQPERRVFIHPEVCEGCGDCSAVSNCLSVMPLETAHGRKRRIDQSSCNTDYSCANGFCPSFVSVEGGVPRQPSASDETPFAVPEPELPAVEKPYGIIVAGIGGAGIMTLGAIVGMAAHLDGRGATVLDMTGLAQRWGAATSYVRIAPLPEDIHATRIPLSADAVIGCDVSVVCEDEATDRLELGVSRAVVNTARAAAGEFTNDPDLGFPLEQMKKKIELALGETDYVDAGALVGGLMGEGILTTVFMLGYAFQKGLIPISAESLMRAIELNGVMAAENRQAFLWGRSAAHDQAAVEALVDTVDEPELTLVELVEDRVRMLTDYQDPTYAGRYRALVDKVGEAETRLLNRPAELTYAVARSYAKLLAYKDEYEVARLYSDASFRSRLEAAFKDGFRTRVYLAPPLLSRPDPVSGVPKKRLYGSWVFPAMGVLAKFKGLRGTPLDVFGRGRDRQLERQLIVRYEALVDEVLAQVGRENHDLALELLSLPEQIRGFGHIKEAAAAAAQAREEELRQALAQSPSSAAAE